MEALGPRRAPLPMAEDVMAPDWVSGKEAVTSDAEEAVAAEKAEKVEVS